MEEQIISAIRIAWEPSSDQNLKRQAFEYVNRLRQAPEAWQPCLNIFTHLPRHAEVVRVFSLEIVNNAVQGGLVDVQGLQSVKDSLMAYLRRAYGPDAQETVPDSAIIENKIAQTITFLFCAFYASGWQSCITDLLDLTKTSSGSSDSLLGSVFYLRVINAIHDEIGDQLLSRSPQEQDRANTLKDLVRERDVQKVASSWQEILASLGTQNTVVAELCLKAIGKWVSWVDIGLVVNQNMMELLFHQLDLAQKEELSPGEEKARDAAIDVLTETVSKKMPSADKINMISFLKLEFIVSSLVSCPRLSTSRGSSTYDVDLAETVAKLVNTTVQDIVRALGTETQNTETWQKAEKMLQPFLVHLLRFFSDEYDEVCSTVLAAMTDVLAFLRKAMQGDEFMTQRAAMLLPILNAIFAKMRYDETASWGDDDEKTDEAEFQDLRKRLGALQQAIAYADEQLFMDAVSGLVMGTFEKWQAGLVDWRDMDLALHEMYLMGDFAVKSSGLYQKDKPTSPAAERLIRMMLTMVQTNIGSYSHPAIQIQHMEICVRYSQFFNKHGGYVQQILLNFLMASRHQNLKVRFRAWYLLHRFIRQQKQNAGNSAEAVIASLQDLLVVKAEVSNDDAEDDMSSENESSSETMFTSQLWLFEAAGCVVSASGVPADRQIRFVQGLMQPIFNDIEANLQSAKSGNEQATLQIHHDIMALGSIARGYFDWTGNNPSATGLDAPEAVKEAYLRVSEVTLVALESLKESFDIRTAARFAFSRLIGMVGRQMMQQLPRWVDGLLTESSSRDEMAQFLRLLDQVTFGFKNDIFGFLDSMFTGLLQRVFSGISVAAAGTDDEIELAELKREYLNFLLVVLGNDLGGVLVSATNQPIFESVIGTIEHFTKDTEDFPTAKMAFQLLNRMCIVWGGPDVIVTPTPPSNNQAAAPSATSQSTLPGFNQFMVQRFSPLCWALPLNPAFNVKDAQARQVMAEAAALQKTIYAKTGNEYLNWLRDNELKGMVGMEDVMMEDFLTKFVSLDLKGWRQHFTNFISQGGRT